MGNTKIWLFFAARPRPERLCVLHFYAASKLVIYSLKNGVLGFLASPTIYGAKIANFGRFMQAS